MTNEGSRWASRRDVQRGADYDRRWRALADAGEPIHGEADFVCRFLPTSVLDAGCGTGRVAIELARRGIEVVGVDLDEAMIGEARSKAPDLAWHTDDIVTVNLARTFDVVALAGNVMIFLRPGTETAAVANLARHVRRGGVLVAGFQLRDSGHADEFDADGVAAGLQPVERCATWDGDPYDGGNYAVHVHRRPLDNT